MSMYESFNKWRIKEGLKTLDELSFLEKQSAYYEFRYDLLFLEPEKKRVTARDSDVYLNKYKHMYLFSVDRDTMEVYAIEVNRLKDCSSFLSFLKDLQNKEEG